MVYETDDAIVTVRPLSIGHKDGHTRDGRVIYKVSIQDEDDDIAEEYYVTSEVKDQILKTFRCDKPKKEAILEETEEEVEL